METERAIAAPSLRPLTIPTPTIAAVIPALNEGAAIGHVVGRLNAEVGRLIDEIIVVDNGSSDCTASVARAAGARVIQEERRGYGAACLAGVRAAEGAHVIVLLDGDGADDASDIPDVLEPLLASRADLVVGSRTLGLADAGAMTPQQLAGNRVAAGLMRLLHGMRVSDLGPMRAIRRDDLLRLDPREMTYGWSVEMAVKARRAGYVYQEVPVRYHCRVGSSKVSGTVGGSLRAGGRILWAVLRAGCWRPEVPAGQVGPEVVRRQPPSSSPRRRHARPSPRLDSATRSATGAPRRSTEARFPFGWYVAPGDGWPEIAPCVALCGGGPVLFQGSGGWGERQRALLLRMAGDGADSSVVLIASDSPQIRVETVKRAFHALEEHDLVLGPVLDGGYYLIGMRGFQDVLTGVAMSGTDTFATLLRRAQDLGIATALVEPTFDVDEATDLPRLTEVAARRHDLPATRAALCRLGIVHVPGDVASGAPVSIGANR